MSEKILTIIIPMYQSEHTIQKCLDSMILEKVQMQKLEILVVNDGSIDNGPVIVQKYADRWPGTIKLLEKENGGHGSAVNLGVKVCRGRFFKVVDADDWVRTDGLRQILNLLQQPDAVCAEVVLAGYHVYDIRTSKIEAVTANGKISMRELEKGLFLADQIILAQFDEILHHWNWYRRLFTLHGIIYRTDFYRAAGRRLPEHVYYDDAYFAVVFACRASRIGLTEHVLYVYRVGDDGQSVSEENREKRIRELETVIFQICKTAEDERTKAGTRYWYRKTASVLADYYVTAFLRCKNRSKGRAAARRCSRKMEAVNRKLYQMCRKKYWLLFGMSLLHIKAKWLENFFQMRERLKI